MRYVEEFRDPKAAKVLISAIARVADQLGASREKPVHIMEICGGHTHAIFRYGLDKLMQSVIDTDRVWNKRISTAKTPSHLWIDSRSKIVWASMQDSDEIVAIDLGTQTVKSRTRVGSVPADVFGTPDDKFLLVGLTGSDGVEVYDISGAQPKWVKKLVTGKGAHAFRAKGDQRHPRSILQRLDADPPPVLIAGRYREAGFGQGVEYGNIPCTRRHQRGQARRAAPGGPGWKSRPQPRAAAARSSAAWPGPSQRVISRRTR